MPNPKRRHSKSRGAKRRTHYKAATPAVGICPNCHEHRLLHRACPSCGHYNGKAVIIPKETK